MHASPVALSKKKSVVFNEEPEILKTPPKSAVQRTPGLKSALKGKMNLKIKPIKRIARFESAQVEIGSNTERLNVPAPLLPPFKTTGLQDTLHLKPKKKPVKSFNIVENFNKVTFHSDTKFIIL